MALAVVPFAWLSALQQPHGLWVCAGRSCVCPVPRPWHREGNDPVSVE